MTTVEPGTILPISSSLGILGCINENDGSGFIHALLNAYHPGYSSLKNDYYRTHLAKSVRIGALPDILKKKYGDKILSKSEAAESRFIFEKVMAFGMQLPDDLLLDYADFLNVGYRLFSADHKLLENKETSEKNVANIVLASEDEYHLLVKLEPFQDSFKYKILFHLK